MFWITVKTPTSVYARGERPYAESGRERIARLCGGNAERVERTFVARSKLARRPVAHVSGSGGGNFFAPPDLGLLAGERAGDLARRAGERAGDLEERRAAGGIVGFASQ